MDIGSIIMSGLYWSSDDLGITFSVIGALLGNFMLSLLLFPFSQFCTALCKSSSILYDSSLSVD